MDKETLYQQVLNALPCSDHERLVAALKQAPEAIGMEKALLLVSLCRRRFLRKKKRGARMLGELLAELQA